MLEIKLGDSLSHRSLVNVYMYMQFIGSMAFLVTTLFLLKPAFAEEEEENDLAQSKSSSQIHTLPMLGIHRVTSISPLGNSVELEDGSLWNVNVYDAHKVATWTTSHIIQITQSHRPFSQYRYQVINRTLGDAIEANVALQDAPHKLQILTLDRVREEIVLSDHTRWSISLYNREQLHDWEIADIVVLGYNSDASSTCQGLLINPNRQQKILVEPIQ